VKRLRPSHYWRKSLSNRPIRPQTLAMLPECKAADTIASLSTKPQPALTWFDRIVAIVTTPFKRFGISGWKETGCIADGIGIPVRKGQHSTDGFWTIDLELKSLSIGAATAPFGRYLRLEVEPHTHAHDVCDATLPTQSYQINFGGAVVIDTDGPFLEVHPDGDFNII
jgi:hypothetical protein